MAGHNASRAELPIAKHLWAGPCTHPYHTLAVLCSPYAIHLHAGPCSPLALHLQSHAPLMRHTCRVVFPLRHTLAEPFSPHTTPLQGGVPLRHTLAEPFSPHTTHLQGGVPLHHTLAGRCSLAPHTCRAVSPLRHALAGPCSPHTTHLQGRVPLMPHTDRTLMPLTSRAVFPLPDPRRGMVPICHSLAGLRSRLIPRTRRAVFPLCHSLTGMCLALYTTQSQGQSAHAAARTG